MNARFFTLALAATLCVASASNADAFDSRLWSDETGEFSVVGALDPERSFSDGFNSVVIVDRRGRAYRCAIDKLSETDREYVELARKAAGGDSALEEALDWSSDPARSAGVRRVVDIDGVEYAFRWIPPGKYSEPTDVFDPNLPRSVAANHAESKAKKAAPKKVVRNGFWMLETEVTLEMYNQFVTETKYKPGGVDRPAVMTLQPKGDADSPYDDYDAANEKANAKPKPKPKDFKEKSRMIGYSGTPQKTAGLKRGDEYAWKNPGFPQTKKHPVTLVSEVDATAFCIWLANKTGKGVKLPTTAPWYLAAQPERISVAYSSLFELWTFGGSESWERGNLPDANFPVICPTHVYLMDRINFVYRDSYRFTVPVGSFKPNVNGLYDMVGNVGEIVADDPNVVESLGGSWFHLPGFNPICWVPVSALGYDPIDRAIRDYQSSRLAPTFADPVVQDPYDDMNGGYMYDESFYGGSVDLQGGRGGARVQGNPFAQDNKAKPFVHVDLLDVDATCFTGFRVIIE